MHKTQPLWLLSAHVSEAILASELLVGLEDISVKAAPLLPLSLRTILCSSHAHRCSQTHFLKNIIPTSVEKPDCTEGSPLH